MKKFTLIFTILALVISTAFFTLGCPADQEEGGSGGSGGSGGGSIPPDQQR